VEEVPTTGFLDVLIEIAPFGQGLCRAAREGIGRMSLVKRSRLEWRPF